MAQKSGQKRSLTLPVRGREVCWGDHSQDHSQSKSGFAGGTLGTTSEPVPSNGSGSRDLTHTGVRSSFGAIGRPGLESSGTAADVSSCSGSSSKGGASALYPMTRAMTAVSELSPNGGQAHAVHHALGRPGVPAVVDAEAR